MFIRLVCFQWRRCNCWPSRLIKLAMTTNTEREEPNLLRSGRGGGGGRGAKTKRKCNESAVAVVETNGRNVKNHT